MMTLDPNRLRRVVHALLILSIFAAAPAYAQRDGVIAGRVSDENGNPIEGALISIFSEERGDTRELSTDSDGDYMGRGFRIETVVVTVTADGYQGYRQNLKVNFGMNTLDVVLPTAMAPSNVSFDEINGLYQAGFAAYEGQDWAAARDAMGQLVVALEGLEGEEVGTMRSSALEVLGRAQYETGDQAGAIATYEQLLALAPDSIAAHHWKAQAHAGSQDYASALPHARRAAELAPDDMAMQYNAAVIMLQTDDVAGGVAALERVVEINPEFPLGRKQLGYSYLQLGSQDPTYYQKALDQLKAYIEVAPEAPDRAEVEGLIGALEAQVQQ